jgi:hypothetical protein
MAATSAPCPDCIALEGEPVSVDPHGALTAPDGVEGLGDGSLHGTYRCHGTTARATRNCDGDSCKAPRFGTLKRRTRAILRVFAGTALAHVFAGAACASRQT